MTADRRPSISHWSLVETCSGSAALTLHLLGSKHALLPYQGSKWKVRKALEAFLRSQGLEGPPSRVWLNDVGPFGRTWEALSRWSSKVADMLDRFGEEDPFQVYFSLNRHPVSTESTRFAAEHLFLQRLSHSGKAVTVRNGRWSSPGFNKSSAYGCEGTDRFGPVKPMIPHLVKVVREVGPLLQGVTSSQVDLNHVLEENLTFKEENVLQKLLFLSSVGQMIDKDPLVVFVDPPYVSSTGYGGPMVDPQLFPKLLPLAAAQGRSALVIVCESSPVESLTGDGWSATQLSEKTDGNSPFRSTKEEWITWKTVNWNVATRKVA